MASEQQGEQKIYLKVILHFFGTIIGVAGFCFCLTCLYLAMRGIMDLGGFVASGGPYEIAHQAPNWIWIFFAAIFGGLIFIFINRLNARKVGGLNLLVLAWPALFISLSENFLEYSFNPPGLGSGIVWGWLVCGVTFFLMGFIPFLFIMYNAVKNLRGKIDSNYKGPVPWVSKTRPPGLLRPEQERSLPIIHIIFNLAAVFIGIYGGKLFFEFLAK